MRFAMMAPCLMPWGLFVASVIAATAVCVAVATAAVLSSAWHRRWLDQPNHRSLHLTPVPRVGGLILMACASTLTLVSIGLVAVGGAPGISGNPVGCRALSVDLGPMSWLIILTLPLIIMGALDDLRATAIGTRLAIQLACAVAVVLAVLDIASLTGTQNTALPSTWLSVTAAAGLVLLLMWSANLYNFMDGANGLAGLMTVIGFGGYAFLVPVGSALGTGCAAIAGGALGFLLFNWNKARLFMGDAGSVPIGFLACGVGLYGVGQGYWPWWAPGGLFLPFVLDASVTLVRRGCQGRPVWRAHREHVYQRLILGGWSHRRVSAVYGAWMLACGIATATSPYANRAISIATWTVILLCYVYLILLAGRPAKSPTQID